MKKQDETKTKLDSLPACAAEFIRLVIKKMRYRKKVRQDVQAELTAHFEDDLKDCKSDGDKEQKAQQLITQFGDAKPLAILLRRAKKRCRPLWRTIVARTFQTIGVLILCFIIYTGWFLSGKPVINVDYVAELNRLVRPTADESLNAAPLYHKAAELYEKLPEDSAKLLSKKRNEVTPEEKQLIEKLIADNQQVLDLIIAGTHKPYYWRKYSNDNQESGVMGILLPHLPVFRPSVYALRWRAWLNVENGRYEDAFSDIKSCYRFGKHIKNVDVSLIEQLIGMALERLATQTLHGILNEYQIDSATLTELQQGFEQVIADENFTITFKFEKLATYDEIQRCFTEDRFGGGHLYLDGIWRVGDVADLGGKHWTTPLHILFTHPNKRESREMTDHLYAFLDKMARKSPAQTHAEAIDIEEEAMEIVKGNLLLEILVPTCGRVIELSWQSKSHSEAVLTIIAILRYKQDLGGYPQNPDRLIEAGYLKELPMDPYSDKPLVYKKTDEGFTLYSVGPNFEDDSGQFAGHKKGEQRVWTDEGDAVFWPIPKL